MRRQLFSCVLSLATLGWTAPPARAFPSYGTLVDSTCTANGWIPAKPFNPNSVATPTASTANCGLCHANAASPGARLTTAGTTFKASGYSDVRPFCQPPATNAAPVFAPVAAQRATVGQLFQLSVRATDPDGNALRLAATGLPSGATFADLGAGVGSLGWTPLPAQVGNVVVRFTAADSGTPTAGAALDVTISVGPAPNRPPAFAPVAAQQATAGQLFQLTVRATDPDGDALSLTASNNPLGATFSDRLDGTGFLQWTPAASQAGNHIITFHAVDGGVPMASATLDVAISVGAVQNRPPVLDPIGNRTVSIGDSLTVAFSAADPDNDRITFSAQPLPPGAASFPNGFTWSPSATLSGNYTVTATATDSGTPQLSDSETFVITVGAVNRAPLLSPIGDRSALVGEVARIAVIATDPDGNAVMLRCDGLPADAAFTDLGDGTGEIVWTPTAAGRWSATCRAVDNANPQAADQESFLMTAREPTPPPTGADPALTDARWDVARARLVIAGSAPMAPAGERARLELFVALADGANVSLGARWIEIAIGGAFKADLATFVPPCRVFAAIGGQASAPIAVTSAPARCDRELLMQVGRARLSCDGTLRVAGRRAPPLGTVVLSDGATARTLLTAQARSNGSFEARAKLTAPATSLRAEALAGGHRFSLDELVPVSRERCAGEELELRAGKRDD
jgi:hypothetical protein